MTTQAHVKEELIALLLIAVGGFSTFSTFSYETFRMLEDQDSYTMALNILTNVAGSILGVIAALVICSALPG